MTAPDAGEAAALKLRDCPLPAPVQSPKFTFLIPMVGRHQTGDWDAVIVRLHRTLRSFDRQGEPWRALVASQDDPGLKGFSQAVHVPFRTDAAGNDKWAKLRALVASFGAEAAPGYVMSFDADDVMADGTLTEMRARARDGYLVTRGYVENVGAGRVARAEPQSVIQPGQKAFWKLCGSCAAVRHDLSTCRAEQLAFLSEMLSYEHRMLPYLAALAGRKLVPLREPAVLYLLNHGENFGARRGRVGFKTRFVDRFEVDASEVDAIRARFPDA